MIVVMLAVLSGCQSGRGRFLEQHRPRNALFSPAEMLPDIRLAQGEESFFLKLERGDHQSLHILQIARDARLTKRYHKGRDLTLFCIAGSAIVEVETERHFVTVSTSVFIPRYCTYAIIPHDAPSDFTALAVFSPPYSEDDVVLKE